MVRHDRPKRRSPLRRWRKAIKTQTEEIAFTKGQNAKRKKSHVLVQDQPTDWYLSQWADWHCGRVGSTGVSDEQFIRGLCGDGFYQGAKDLAFNQLIASYVESTIGYELAKDVLIHVYGFGLDLDEFETSEPGETTIHAILRRRWGHLLGVLPSEMPGQILSEFKGRLEIRMATAPITDDLVIRAYSNSGRYDGPVTPSEREQWSLIKGIRAWIERGNEPKAAKLASRLRQLRVELKDPL